MKLEEKRLLDAKELAEYTGLGLTMAREFGKETGAVYSTIDISSTGLLIIRLYGFV